MRKYIYLFTCLLFVLFTAMTCDDNTIHYTSVQLVNNTDEVIWVAQFGFGDENRVLTPYDILILMERQYLKKVLPHESFQGEIAIRDDHFPLDVKTQFLLFKDSTMEKYTDEELAEKNIFDKRYSYTYDQLKAMNFKIVYTGE